MPAEVARGCRDPGGKGHSAAVAAQRAQVVVVGGGFAGLYALRRLERLLPPGTADLVLVNPTDHLVYSPLLPDVTASAIEPRHVAVSLRQALPRTRLLLGHALSADRDARALTVATGERGEEEQVRDVPWDRLLLAPGSVTRRFPIAGVDEAAHGVKTLTEAVFVRDHLLAQLDLADALPDTPEHQAERRERMTVVAVGAGYTGTEVVAQTHRWLTRVASRWTSIDAADVRWVLVDAAPTVLPELGPRLGAYALQVLRARGVEVRLSVSVAAVEGHTVTLTDGTAIPSRTLVWSAGVAASPFMATLGLPTERGRLLTDAQMRVEQDLWAVGDAAAVPDLARQDGAGPTPYTAPTAQHAQRQGGQVARAVAASLSGAPLEPYEHRDLGLVVDLGRRDGVARPLGVPLKGLPAKAVTLGYHVAAVPTMTGRVRVAAELLLAAALPTQTVQLAPLPEGQGTLATEIGAAQLS